MTATIILALLALLAPALPQSAAPDSEGFIHDWLVLAPIPISGDSGAVEIERDLLNGEAALKPKAGDKLSVAGRNLTWTAHQTEHYFIDFLAAFGKAEGEYVAGYAVTYVVAAEEIKATLALSTNDQGRAWLNGREVMKFTETRVLEKDSDRIEVTLAK